MKDSSQWESFFLSGPDWRAAFLQSANQGWRWGKSFRLWPPERNADGLLHIHLNITHELAAESRFAGRRSRVLVTDDDLKARWMNPVNDDQYLTFAAFYEPSRRLPPGDPSVTVPKGPRNERGYGDFFCSRAGEGLSWYWREETVQAARALLERAVREDVPGHLHPLHQLSKDLACGQATQLERALQELGHRYEIDLSQVQQVCGWLHDQAAAWERKPVRLVPLDDAWIRTGRFGFVKGLLNSTRYLLRRTL